MKAYAKAWALDMAEAEAGQVQANVTFRICIPDCSFWCGRKKSVHMQRNQLVYPWLFKILKLVHKQLVESLAESAVVDRC